MSHCIDLKNLNTRTDLAIELLGNKKDKQINETIIDNIKVTSLEVNETEEKEIGKKKGNYITIEFDDVTDYDNSKKVEKVLIDELKKLLNKLNIKETASVLVVGLGNDKSTADSLGPFSINNIIVTGHLFNMNIEVEDGFRKVFAINTGVTGQTGIETSDIILSVIDRIKPDFLIVVDALKASSINRLNKTIQLSDSGISPGSGIGNKRKEISFDTVSIPVIAIGVPTVVDAVTIVSDTFDYITKDYTYISDNINNSKEKLIVSHNISKKDIVSNLTYKKQLFGLVGSLKESEFKQLIEEVLSSVDYNLIVSPKEIDFLIQRLSLLIGTAINNAIHRNVNDL